MERTPLPQQQAYCKCLHLLCLDLGLLRLLIVPVIVTPLFMIQFSLGFIIPNCLALSLQPFPQIAGSAGGILGFLFLFSGAITSSILANFTDGEQVPLALSTLVIGIIGIILFASMIMIPQKMKLKI